MAGCRGPEKWTSVAAAHSPSALHCAGTRGAAIHHPRLKSDAGKESAPWILGCQLRQYVLNILICPFNVIPPESTTELLGTSSTYVFISSPKGRVCYRTWRLLYPSTLL